MPNATPRVLTIQSHVVSGYCGNKSATFPLQLLEFEVDVINSCQISNHTRYPVFKGQIFGEADLSEIVEGLKGNSLLKLYDHVLSGYVIDVSFIEKIGQLIEDIKAETGQKCWYTFDPVLGDDDTGYYVPGCENVTTAYQEYLIPLADIITPNRFEASVLSGVEIGTSSSEAIPQALKAIDYFHDRGIKIVIITSFDISEDELACIISYEKNAKTRTAPSGPGPREVYSICIPKLEGSFTGTGDLFAALITAWLHKSNFDIKLSLENTANAVHDILEDTIKWMKFVDDGTEHSKELRLVQNKKHIMNPSKKFKAKILET